MVIDQDTEKNSIVFAGILQIWLWRYIVGMVVKKGSMTKGKAEEEKKRKENKNTGIECDKVGMSQESSVIISF
jgi:hypothetical protein